MSESLSVDRDRCMGSGQCTFYAPATFDLDEDSIAVVISDDGDSAEKIQMAIDVCPTRAIAKAATAVS
ncbi:ferredoxin [Microbacterium sp. Leaf159]|uniref:ferredoxin n=1 Tax=Microbacterium sp. Leaf159 TaxID=1736279 RepID=UPI0009EBEA43|nr:ferredoxin [Microbacterium sp. Leaf159]